MNPQHDKIVRALAIGITPVKMGAKAALWVFLPPMLLGLLVKGSDFVSDPINLWVLIGIFTALLIPVMFLITQRVDIEENGLIISGPLRKTTELNWDQITKVNFNRRFRWISISGENGIAYFNSMDGLKNAHDLGIVAAYHSGYRCPPKVKAEVESLLNDIDYDTLLAVLKIDQELE